MTPTDIAPPARIEEVSDGVYAYVQPDGSWCLNNPAFIAGSNGVTCIDACATERRSRELLAAIDRTTDRPVHTLVNTHHHLDHTFGNFVFGPEVTIVGHARCRDEILETAGDIVDRASLMFPGVDWGAVEIVAPSVTLEQPLALYVDDLRLELIPVAPAHTTNDVVVWIPERRVLIAGDMLFNGGTPFAVFGSVAGWLESLETLRCLGADVIVPGHGDVCDACAIDDVAEYLRWIQKIAKSGFDAGAAPLDVARDADLGRFAQWSDPERLAGNLHRAYSELRGEPNGAPIDAAAAFGDVIAYAGGGPLRCLA
jgi:cyclase